MPILTLLVTFGHLGIPGISGHLIHFHLSSFVDAINWVNDISTIESLNSPGMCFQGVLGPSVVITTMFVFHNFVSDEMC